MSNLAHQRTENRKKKDKIIEIIIKLKEVIFSGKEIKIGLKKKAKKPKTPKIQIC